MADIVMGISSAHTPCCGPVFIDSTFTPNATGAGHDFSVRVRVTALTPNCLRKRPGDRKELGTDVKDGQVPPPPTGHRGADRFPAGHRARRDTRPAFSMCTAV